MSAIQTSLTGITTTGIPHLGNYVGAIRPAIAASKQQPTNQQQSSNQAQRHCYFLADYHALIKCQEPERIHQSTLAIAATWLAFGLDPEQVLFYRQSDIPEIPELTWLLSCVAAKGLMNRAHAYKDSVANNVAQNEDADYAISMGLFGYPVLMAADILMFNATKVPVGRDQNQHLEMTRDIAQRFNFIYGDHFAIPEAVIDDSAALLQGLDGRKMSKSYNNTIPLFLEPKPLRKLINKIITNSLEPGQPKDTKDSTLYQIWCAFATPQQSSEMAQAYADGIAWGEAKKLLFELLDEQLAEPRQHYQQLMSNPANIEATLLAGAEKARQISKPLMANLRHAVGLRPLG